MADNPLASPASPARGLALPDSAQGTLSYLDMSPSFRDRVGADWLANMAGAEVLPCPTLRDVLEAHTSPFVAQPNQRFVSDRDRVDLQSVHFASPSSAGVGSHGGLAELARQAGEYAQLPRQAIRAGPRETIYHAPPTAHIAIVTCGGLCPGLNDVVRGLVLKALDYGVLEKNILGVRYGLKGFASKTHPPIKLTREVVESIHLEGGTMLGTSRTRVDVREVVKRLDLWKIDMLFVVGGPGGHRAALEIQLECGRSRVPCCVVALPKSIDNDMLLLDRTFGYETAVEEAQTALLAAKVEASSGYRGLGLVKLMGRRSGFIAVQASLASGLVDACLIPEVPFRVAALASYLQGVIERKGHAVVCVAEGAALDLMEGPPPAVDGVGRRLSVDAAGRPASKDVGAWLKKELKRAIPDADLKLIDPSYLIRSVPPHSSDRVYCRMLAHGALHAGFAGYTGISVGLVNTQFVYLPIPLVVEAPRLVDPNGELWNRLRSAVGQPDFSHDPADGAPSLGRVASGTIA